MSSLTVTGLRKSFPAGSGSRARSAPTVAVAGVSLAVQQGSITGVLGPSGCGKTTLLRMVAGFVRPDSGEIRFGDRVVCGPGLFVPPQLRRVGYVPQEGALFPHLTVAANIAFGLPPRDPARDARVGELLDLIELPSAYADRQPRELSGGQQQRVALARALAARPAVVLLDEPFSSLDAGLRTSTGQAVVRALRASGATAVLVTHDQDEALSLTDQVAVMRDGTVIQVDSPRGLYEHPADLDVAHFVGGATLLPRRAVAALLDAVALDGGDEDEMVVIRPEQVMLSTDGTGHPAEVTQTAYYGHDATVHLELSGPSDAGSGPITLVARVVGSAAPEPGARVGVRIAGPVRALPTSPGGRLPI